MLFISIAGLVFIEHFIFAVSCFDENKQNISELDFTREPNVNDSNLVEELNRKQQNDHNYADVDCGARVISSNKEAVHASSILEPNNLDTYTLNPCSIITSSDNFSKLKGLWFIVELCEKIEITKLLIGNLELYSSNPKTISLFALSSKNSNLWLNLGTFNANDTKTIQSFDVKTKLFSRVIRVEITSYYGKHHFCPISNLQIFGKSFVDGLHNETLEDFQQNAQIYDELNSSNDYISMSHSNFGESLTSPSIKSSVFNKFLDVFGMIHKALVNHTNNNHIVKDEDENIDLDSSKIISHIEHLGINDDEKNSWKHCTSQINLITTLKKSIDRKPLNNFLSQVCNVTQTNFEQCHSSNENKNDAKSIAAKKHVNMVLKNLIKTDEHLHNLNLTKYTKQTEYSSLSEDKSFLYNYMIVKINKQEKMLQNHQKVLSNLNSYIKILAILVVSMVLSNFFLIFLYYKSHAK